MLADRFRLPVTSSGRVVGPGAGRRQVRLPGHEPGPEAAANAARELSHDLHPATSGQQDEAVATSAWIAAVPADDVARSASRETSHKITRPADDHQRESRLRPGRHRKRLVARLMLASQ